MDFPMPTIADFVVAVVLTATVFLPLLTLLHELGHAVVALRVTTGAVHVDVGRQPALVRLRLGRLFVTFSPLPPRGVPFAGVCMYQRSSRRPLAELALLLAGPGVNALATLVLGVLALSTLHVEPMWLTLTLTSGALLALVAFLYNIDPRPASRGERMRVEVRRDGPKALRCYRVWRAGGIMQLTPRTAAARSEARSGNPHSPAPPDQR
jgi:hypothetical protein